MEQQTEMPQPVPTTPEAKKFAAGKVVGVSTLVLIFMASATATTAYLSNGTPQADASQTQAASVAIAPVPSPPDPFENISLQAESAYVVDLTDGHVLFSKNPDAQLPLASLTKVAMALAVSEVLPLDSQITIPYDTAPAGSAERLAKGEVWNVQDVITFTLVASSNDGADILSQAANDALHAKYPQSPAQNATVWRMNNIVQNLGLTNTYYLNDNGLDISTTQAGAYGSARDMAKLFAYAATTDPQVFAGTTQSGLLLTSVNGDKTSVYNTDLALGSIPGLIMGKTGYTDLAGGNLAVVFDIAPSHPVVAIVMHSTEDGRFEDMKTIVADTITAINEDR